MDIASIVGFAMGIVMVVLGIVTGEAGPAALPGFIHGISLIITVGGSVTGTLMAHSIQDFIKGVKGIFLIMKVPDYDPGNVIKTIIDLSNIARKEGLLALEEAANGIEDEFLKKGIMLVVDGTDPELVRGILETDLMCIEDRHKQVIAFWDKWGELAPAWGMIGTLIGLVNMLRDLSDAASIGPNMATALLTTLYGSLIANWICSPTSHKLKSNNDNEIRMKEVSLEGLLSIQAGENPRIIEEKLKSFLSPEVRSSLSDSGGEE
ncbi:MAG: motility protein A [Eubacterium sp.]|nr:motility protein A [Eubacterium sp.]